MRVGKIIGRGSIIILLFFLTACQIDGLITQIFSTPPSTAAFPSPPSLTPPNVPSQPLPTDPTILPSATIQPTPTPHTPAPTATPVPVIAGLFNIPPDLNPLTGLQVADQNILERRPVLVKVSNYPPSVRPQSGLSFADMVFEYYIGEGTNRFLALYYGNNAEWVGSIRSGRLIDGQLVSMYQGILVYGSADPRVDEILELELNDRAISHLQAPCPPVCGAETHMAPWVYVNTAELTKYADEHGINNNRPDLRGTLYDPNPPDSQNFAIKISTEYAYFNRGEWHYNPVNGLYERWQETNLNKKNMVPHTDRLTDKQLGFANIIILFARYTEFNPTLHDVDIWKNSQGQRSIYFRDGIKTEGTWQTNDPLRPIQFYDDRGLPYALKPGNTWIVVAGLNSSFEEIKTGEFELFFDLP